MSNLGFNLFSFSGRIRVLHFTWFAFFLTFVVWFNHAPLMASIREALNLSDQQVKLLLILNVTLTIPARIVIGMLVDVYGPRRLYSGLLLISSGLCFAFAVAQDFERMALLRLLLGFVGAGFVIGIRMVGEWFPAKEVGLAEGIYGGWGNFGSAAAALSLPTLALLFGGPDGWRYAIGLTGVLALVYSGIFFFSVTDTPKGSTYFKPKKNGAMEVTSRADFALYLTMSLPLFAALALLIWKVGPSNLGLLSAWAEAMGYLALIAVYLVKCGRAYQVNRAMFREPIPEMQRYRFRQVAILDLAYLVTFGSELAVVSMLPLFFIDTFGLSQVTAGLLAGGYTVLVIFARPGGGWISDRFGRKRSLLILLAGLAAGYGLMGLIDASWSVGLAVIVIMLCSLFVHAGNGAVFAVVPLVKRRLTGQIAGMVGAYGSVGAVSFLTVLSFVSPQIFFFVIAASALLVTIGVALFLEEPQGHMVEVLPDGTVQLIEVK